MLKSKKAKSIWLRNKDDKSVRFLKKLLNDKFMRPLLIISDEPVTAQELIEMGISYIPYDLEFYGLSERFRDDRGTLKYRLTREGLNISIALKHLIATIDENLRGGESEKRREEDFFEAPSDPLYIP